MVEYSDYLVHHGILGQRWGVRRYQNPDGSLTEEGRKHKDDIIFKKGSKLDHLSGDKKLKLRGNVNPEGVVAASVGVVGLNPVMVAIGSKIAKRTLNEKKLFVYDDTDDHDKNVYEGAFSKFVRDKKVQDNISKGKDWTTAFLENDIYKYQYETKKDLRSPSKERRVDLFVETYRKNEKLMSDQLAAIDRHVQNSNLSPVLKSKSGKIKDYKNVSDEDLKKYGYHMFNIANEFQDEKSVKMNNKYYKTLVKNGYNALIDDNNQGKYNLAHNPMIVLNAKKYLNKISSEELTPKQEQEAEERLRKYLKKKIGSDKITI